MKEHFYEKLNTVMEFIKGRSTWIGLSFVVLIVVIYASACGNYGENLSEGEDSSGEETLVIESSTGESIKEESTDLAVSVTESTGQVYSVDSGTKEPDTIYVFVCGAVNKEGVYELPSGSRAYEAVTLAGGLSEEADSGYVNQALPLSDGDRLYIPTKEETKEQARMEAAGAVTSAANTSAESTASSTTYGITSAVNDQSSGMEAAAVSSSTDTGSSSLVNINTADEEKLKTLSGIGASRAAAIISYREAHGSFSTTEDIMNVAGIGEGIYGNIKDSICVQ